MFEDKALADEAVIAVEKVVHHEDMGTSKTHPKTLEAEHLEDESSKIPSKV